jgi:hypothetical protein
MIADDPLVVVDVDLEDSEIGHVTVTGCSLKEPLVTDFSADEEASDWLNYTLLDYLPTPEESR